MLYTKTIPEIEKIFDCNAQTGLSAEVAKQRLAKNGRNELIEKKGKTYLQMFLSQITEPLIYVLLAAFVICFFLREYSDCIIILSVIIINMPSLAERLEDIPDLVKHFSREICGAQGRSIAVFEDDAIEALQACPWTGNIRELRNVVERLIILCPGNISAEDVKKYM